MSIKEWVMRKLLALVTIMGISAACITPADADPVKLGAHYYSNQTISTGWSTIFAPSANVSGATLTSIELYNVGGAITVAANYPDGSTRYILESAATGSGSAISGRLPYSISLPAGVGLSVIEAGASLAAAYVTYDLLN
jgi:hypothetical protein